MDNIFDTKPDLINEIGVKWWHNKSLTDYAQRDSRVGKGLEMVAYYTEMPDGKRSFVLVDKDGVAHEGMALDGVAAHIDVLKLANSHMRKK